MAKNKNQAFANLNNRKNNKALNKELTRRDALPSASVINSGESLSDEERLKNFDDEMMRIAWLTYITDQPIATPLTDRIMLRIDPDSYVKQDKNMMLQTNTFEVVRVGPDQTVIKPGDWVMMNERFFSNGAQRTMWGNGSGFFIIDPSWAVAIMDSMWSRDIENEPNEEFKQKYYAEKAEKEAARRKELNLPEVVNE